MNLVLTKTRGRIGILGRVAVYADFTQQDKDSFATNTRHQQPSKFLSIYSSTQIQISQQIFYHYDYPFHFNQFFITYRNQYECIVKLRIIQSFSQQSLIKEFNLNDLLHQYKRSANQIPVRSSGSDIIIFFNNS